MGPTALAAWIAGAAFAVLPSPALAGADVAVAPGVNVRELRPGHWLHVTLGPDGIPANGLAVRLEDGVLLVDTGWNEGQADALADWAEATLGAPVRRAIVTHSHVDRTGGAHALRRRGVRVLALDRTVALMQGAGAFDTFFAASMPIATEAGAFEAFYPGAGHAPDNIVVWFPGPRILFGGCMVKAEDADGLGNVADADLTAWPHAIEAVRARYTDAAIVVPGHGPVGGPGALGHTLDLLRPKAAVEPSTGMRLIRIPPGTFTMGSPKGEPLREEQEVLHVVRLTRPFWIGEHEVTQAEWEEVMSTRPSHFAGCGGRCPVENVNFADVQEFLSRLNRKTAGGFRLPTEAEWEYVCRAGTTTAFSTGAALTKAQANYGGTGPLPVDTFPPNAWGVADMHGNVWEWCRDWYCPYGTGPATDPAGSCASGRRVIRGGSWAFGPDSARCALRYMHHPQDRGPSLGFRVARDEK